MGFERNYQLRIPAKQLLNRSRSFTSLNISPQQSHINSWFITGFTDAEGSFMITIIQNEKSKMKFASCYAATRYCYALALALLASASAG